MKIKKTVVVTMEVEDRMKIIDFYNLVNEWVKDIEDVGAKEDNQMYTNLVEIMSKLHNFLRDYTWLSSGISLKNKI